MQLAVSNSVNGFGIGWPFPIRRTEQEGDVRPHDSKVVLATGGRISSLTGIVGQITVSYLCAAPEGNVKCGYTFLTDLQKRLVDARFQLTTDGFHFYQRGVEDVFAGQTDFAQLVKLFGDYGQHDEGRYSPPRITEVISKIRDGRPDLDHICISHVERQNLTMRMAMRRFTRLTNGFSKKLENLKAAVALHFAYYNFVRIHSSLRVTPAMEARITDHAWSLRELVEAGV
jgi:hypothetical protein